MQLRSWWSVPLFPNIVWGNSLSFWWSVPSFLIGFLQSICFSLLLFCKVIVSDKNEYVNTYFEKKRKKFKDLDKMN